MKPYPFYRVKDYILKKTKKIYVFKKDFQIEYLFLKIYYGFKFIILILKIKILSIH